jgi:peptide deformylase
MDGNEFEQVVEGVGARAILHEFDHLEGKLFIDHLSPLSRTLLRGKLKKLARAS